MFDPLQAYNMRLQQMQQQQLQLQQQAQQMEMERDNYAKQMAQVPPNPMSPYPPYGQPMGYPQPTYPGINAQQQNPAILIQHMQYWLQTESGSKAYAELMKGFQAYLQQPQQQPVNPVADISSGQSKEPPKTQK